MAFLHLFLFLSPSLSLSPTNIIGLDARPPSHRVQWLKMLGGGGGVRREGERDPLPFVHAASRVSYTQTEYKRWRGACVSKGGGERVADHDMLQGHLAMDVVQPPLVFFFFFVLAFSVLFFFSRILLLMGTRAAGGLTPRKQLKTDLSCFFLFLSFLSNTPTHTLPFFRSIEQPSSPRCYGTPSPIHCIFHNTWVLPSACKLWFRASFSLL